MEDYRNDNTVKEFLKANESLIDELKEHKNIHDFLEKLREYYSKDSKDLFFYARVQLGLAKYLDFNLDQATISNLSNYRRYYWQ